MESLNNPISNPSENMIHMPPMVPRQDHTKMIISIIVIILLAGAGFVFVKYPGLLSQPKKFSTENVVFKDNRNNLPTEFFNLLPIEKENITQNATLEYTDRGTILYSLSYTSSKQIEELFAIYGNFLKESGFTIKENKKSPRFYNYKAIKDSTELSIVISSQSALKNLVQIGYVTKQ